MALTMLGLSKEIQSLRHEQNVTNRLLRDITAKFAYYWYNEKRKCFAIITELNADKAALVAFHDGWSGGIHVIIDSPMLLRDGETPDDELVKTNKWEPLWELPTVILEALKHAAERAKVLKIEVDETEHASDSAEGDPEDPAAA